MARASTLNQQILRLALPALGALVAEPVFLLTNTALVGHLGLEALAALGVASAVLQTTVGLMIFLAYSTTPQVARRVGAGDTAGAVSIGLSGIWLALALGVVLIAAGLPSSHWLVSLFGLGSEVTAAAEQYWLISLAGVPAMLGVLAAAGILRGLQNTVTPLWIAGIGFVANAVLNALLIYPLGLGLNGSAIGTVITQWGMFVAYLTVIARLARIHQASWRPELFAILLTARMGGWLFLRTLSLRAGTLMPLAVVAPMGTAVFAGYQLIATLYTSAAYALEALEVAGQALTGKALGTGDTTSARAVLGRLLLWGLGFGAALGVLVGLLSPWLGGWLSGSVELAALLRPALMVLAIALPIGGLAFMLDGALIGAGDVRFLALIGLFNVGTLGLGLWLLASAGLGGATGLAWTVATYFIGYIAVRFITLFLRSRGSAWMHLG